MISVLVFFVNLPLNFLCSEQMKVLKAFDIPFVSLKQGVHLFEYTIDKMFFEAFNFDDFLQARVQVVVHLEKQNNFLKISFSTEGTVTIPCDVTSEAFEQKIKATLPLLIKFGDTFNDDDDEILILPHQAYQVNIAQYVYEMVVLAVPAKRIHPKVLEGSLPSKAIAKSETSQEQTTDPRWDKLKNIITQKEIQNGTS